MPSYDYLCDRCGLQQELRFSMAEMKSSVPCSCGAEASRAILSVPESFVRFREYAFDPMKRVGNNGKKFGRTVEQQHEGYRRRFDTIRKNIRGLNRNASKTRFEANGVRYLGGMPGEMADSIGQQERDPEAVAKDPETWLKKTGMYVGEGE